MREDILHEVIAKIADLTDDIDPEDGNTQWGEGYTRACSDIVQMICRMAQDQRIMKS